jgi:predicted transcriptional regulator YdeE
MTQTQSQPQITETQPFTVLGFAVRTDSPGSAEAIPQLWQRVQEQNLLQGVPGRVGDEIYAVYSQLEHAGQSREGWFTFLIGVRVEPATPVPEGMTLLAVPGGSRANFAVPNGDPSRVIEAWNEAWAFDDTLKSFVCEFEAYGPTGAIVSLGLVAERLAQK